MGDMNDDLREQNARLIDCLREVLLDKFYYSGNRVRCRQCDAPVSATWRDVTNCTNPDCPGVTARALLAEIEAREMQES